MATVTLLNLKSRFYRYMGQQWTGAATGGSTTSLVDTTLINMASSEFPVPLEGKQIRVTSGASTGDLRYVAKADHATGTLYANRPFSSTGPAAADTYELWASSINGGQPLTSLFNDILPVAMPLQQSQLTTVTRQTVYDITPLVVSPESVWEVYIRRLDPNNLEPYEPRPISWWRAYPLQTVGAQTMKLEISPWLTLTSPATEELWIEYQANLPDFTTDTSTVDVVYQEWLAWEAVLHHAVQMKLRDTDKGRWAELGNQAVPQVQAWRALFMPRRPKRMMHGRPQVM